MESWKDIKGYEGLYQVSDYGRVKSLGRKKGGGLADRYLGNLDKQGYVRVVLSKDGKTKNWQVHRLVYESFCGEIPNNMVINHKDENPSNNHIDNLEICTPKENANYGNRNYKLSCKNGKIVECIETGERFRSASYAAKKLGLSQVRISSCCRGERHTTGGYHFKYV
jgi:hypothetical protein